MSTFRRTVPSAVALILLLALPALAQDQPQPQTQTQTPAPAQAKKAPPPTSGYDRLFLSFFEDATITDSQWWEGQFEYADYDNFDAMLVRGVFAFNPVQDVEVGGRVGFGSTDSDLFRDGSGATDLDLFGKYYFGSRGGSTEYATGVVLTIPTGDDAVGLGFDAFSAGVFGSARYRLRDAILTGNVGFRLNGDGRVIGVDIDGEFSPFLGLGYIRPVSDEVTFIGEVRMETERFDGADSDIRVLGGINLRAFNQGMLRTAVGVGLDDGAPDLQFIVGYAHTF